MTSILFFVLHSKHLVCIIFKSVCMCKTFQYKTFTNTVYPKNDCGQVNGDQLLLLSVFLNFFIISELKLGNTINEAKRSTYPFDNQALSNHSKRHWNANTTPAVSTVSTNSREVFKGQENLTNPKHQQEFYSWLHSRDVSRGKRPLRVLTAELRLHPSLINAGKRSGEAPGAAGGQRGR